MSDETKSKNKGKKQSKMNIKNNKTPKQNVEFSQETEALNLAQTRFKKE